MSMSEQQSSDVLTGHVAVVTGGARGIGAAIVRALHGAGATVVAAGGSPAHGAALADEFADGRCVYEPHDVGDESSWRQLADRVVAEHGPVSILVNNAGIYQPGVDITATSTENF